MMVAKDKTVTSGSQVLKLHASQEKKFLSDLKAEAHKKKRKRRVSALSSSSDRSSSPVRIAGNTNAMNRSNDEFELPLRDNMKEGASPLQSPKKKRLNTKSDGPLSGEKIVMVPSIASIPEEAVQ